MKSEINYSKPNLKFPCVMIGRNTGGVYLISKTDSCCFSATCVYNPGDIVGSVITLDLGQLTELFTIFTGTVTLSND